MLPTNFTKTQMLYRVYRIYRREFAQTGIFDG
jgi:hypothetical protein